MILLFKEISKWFMWLGDDGALKTWSRALFVLLFCKRTVAGILGPSETYWWGLMSQDGEFGAMKLWEFKLSYRKKSGRENPGAVEME